MFNFSKTHILWFDECYDEIYYKFETSISITEKTDLLIVIGTTGNTTLPSRIITTVMEKTGRNSYRSL
jgi:NAD-dependent deacetylase